MDHVRALCFIRISPNDLQLFIMILLITVLSGLSLFQFLIAWEAFRCLVRDYNKALAINWFVMPREKRSFQRKAHPPRLYTKRS